MVLPHSVATLAFAWPTMTCAPTGRPKALDVVTKMSRAFTLADAPVEVMEINCSFNTI